MTLQEAKDQITEKYRYNVWCFEENKDSYWEEAAELYAQSKWEEAVWETLAGILEKRGRILPSDSQQ